LRTKKPCSATDPLWYKDAVIYEIHVRAFADSNADGIGDFQGLISKLDYLQELGVTCLWLLPFFPSPLRDDGYDIADYTSVNPQYGTLDDFQQFLNEAHARNIQVMIELVINHTSDQHPWFQRARLAPKGSPDRNMYVWSDTDKLYDGVRIIFTDTEKSNWTWDDTAKAFYWHRFFSHQPDRNLDNPRVMEEVLNAMRFWMDMGVDGLRLDAIPYLIERDGTSCENVPETHVLIKHIRSVMDAEYENRLILAEANMWPADVRPYFGDGDECQMAFHFPLMPRIYMALRQEDRHPITDIMAQTPAIPDNCQWGLFLRNHDELTLEMVTDDERDYMNIAYAADTRMRINVGIRRRLAPLMDNNRRRIELLNSLLLSFPGTPIMYYGDEIGMGDNIYLGDRNGVRTPMQWNADRNAGFSKAVPAKLYFPVIMDPIWGYQAINVEAQESDPSSLLHWTRNMIALRKLFQVFGRGTLEFLHPENRKILAYIRDCEFPDGHSETILCVANLSRFAQPVSLDLTKYSGRQPVEMLGYVAFPEVTTQPYPLTLAPYSFLWLELQPAPAQPIAASLPEALTPDFAPLTLATLLAEPWLARIEALLPNYIAQQRWFGGKSKTISSARIVSASPIVPGESVSALIDLTYAGDTKDLYHLPLALLPESQATAIKQTSPQAIIATLTQPGAPMVLFDATASSTFRSALLSRIAAGPQSGLSDLTASHATTLNPSDLTNLPSRVGSAEQSNTSILYGDTAILKLFRRLSPTQNPDVEITRSRRHPSQRRRHHPRLPPSFRPQPGRRLVLDPRRAGPLLRIRRQLPRPISQCQPPRTRRALPRRGSPYRPAHRRTPPSPRGLLHRPSFFARSHHRGRSRRRPRPHRPTDALRPHRSRSRLTNSPRRGRIARLDPPRLPPTARRPRPIPHRRPYPLRPTHSHPRRLSPWPAAPRSIRFPDGRLRRRTRPAARRPPPETGPTARCRRNGSQLQLRRPLRSQHLHPTPPRKAVYS
jgi:maltose alpha-D-glucosyltransferase/alpha-amylase